MATTATVAKSSGRGSKPGEHRGGRKAGVSNKRTAEQVEAIKASGMTPLQYLTSVYQDVSADEAKRIDAAKAAAPYCHAKLQPIDPAGDTTQKIAVTGALTWQPPQ